MAPRQDHEKKKGGANLERPVLVVACAVLKGVDGSMVSKSEKPASSASVKSAKLAASMHTILLLSLVLKPSMRGAESSVGHSRAQAPTPELRIGYNTGVVPWQSQPGGGWRLIIKKDFGPG